MKIRMMKDDDIPQVAEIEKKIFSVPWSEASFSQSLENNTIYIVCTEGDRIVGYCGMYLMDTEGNITNVAVAPDCRRKGVGKSLIAHILLLAKEKGVCDVVLEVRKTNMAAIKLYEDAGFKEAGMRKNFYEKPMEDALIMWKHDLQNRT